MHRRQITRLSTGCDDEQMHAALYTHFAEASAWKITDGAIDSLQQLKASGHPYCRYQIPLMNETHRSHLLLLGLVVNIKFSKKGQ